MKKSEGFFGAIRALLPTGRAWDITQEKNLRKLFESIAPLPENIRREIEGVYLDYFPETTRALEEWEKTFHVRFSAFLFSESERRIVLKVLWLLRYGNTTAEFMQRILRCIVPRINVTENTPVGNPIGLSFAYRSVNGNKYMCCGNKNAFCNFHVGEQPPAHVTYRSVNGNRLTVCGNKNAYCNYNLGDPPWRPYVLRNDSMEVYDIPPDARYWAMCFFISGEVFRDDNRRFIVFQRIKVAAKWRQFIEYVVLALKPVQSTAILFVQYMDDEQEQGGKADAQI